jgi:hypothetical protein
MIIQVEIGLIFEKNNKNKKLKHHFKNGYKIKKLWKADYNFINEEVVERFYEDEYFPNIKNYYFRKIKTKQERMFFEHHNLEYSKEFNLKLRKRRSSKNLPNSWDEIHSGVFKTNKSWKHNSKRKKQYYK